ncbi:MAG: penicillin-insensitive murein endopeptidase [Hyphomicrobiaceae bacterium]
MPRLAMVFLIGAFAVGGGLAAIAAAPAKQPAAAHKASAPTPARKHLVKRPAKAPPAHKAPLIEAKAIFGAMSTPAPLRARAIGFYSRGCLAGAKPLPIDGPTWQAMRLSRNRNWGHPELIAVVERLSKDGKAKDGWPGLLVGDISQPRGGPMLTGHASHQVGLDADVWLTPMPDRRLSHKERENLSATSMLGADKVHVDPKVWTPAHANIILRAASYASVERVLVHPGIKKALCAHPGANPHALAKIRPYWGHHYHMHIRIGCPKGSGHCKPQPPVGADTGCGKEVDTWIALLQRPKPPPQPKAKVKPAPPRPGLTLAQLPRECRDVVEAGAPATTAEAEARAKIATAAAPGKVAAPPVPASAQK